MHRLFKRLLEACFHKGFWQAVYAAQLRPSKSKIYEVHLRTSTYMVHYVISRMLVYLIHKLTCMQFSRYNHWLISLSLTTYMKYKPMGLSGLEPPTSRLSGVRSNQLSYKPIFQKFNF